MQSYANAVLSSFEDPEKILEQAVLEMNGDLTKMRQATAQVSCNFFFYLFCFGFFFIINKKIIVCWFVLFFRSLFIVIIVLLV